MTNVPPLASLSLSLRSSRLAHASLWLAVGTDSGVDIGIARLSEAPKGPSVQLEQPDLRGPSVPGSRGIISS